MVFFLCILGHMKSKNKTLIIIIIFSCILFGGLFIAGTTFFKKESTDIPQETLTQIDKEPSSEIATDLGSGENPLELVALPGPDADDPAGTEVFIGQLQALDTGCFADGECFVIVDDKKITTMIGGRGVKQDNLGEVKGFDSFVALFDYIGSFVEVKALRKEDGSYTLYGSSDYYIKLF
jgi:hypothetical protein